jgi:hypothetical protein
MVKHTTHIPKIKSLNPTTDTSGLYYKHITIINNDSSIINKFETSLTDDARVIIYNRHMFIEQATGEKNKITVSNPRFPSKKVILKFFLQSVF